MTSEERVQLCTLRDELFHPSICLPEICLRARAAITGASDPWDLSFFQRVLHFLSETIRLWDPCGDAIDAAVLTIVYSTRDLISEYLQSMVRKS